MLTGIVEADSTLVGGLLKNMPHERRARLKSRNPRAGKTIVHALRERRTGNIRAGIILGETHVELRELIEENVEPGSCLHTDSSHAYKGMKLDYIHHSVNHTRGEYVRDDVHVNGCECFFNTLRRGLKGTYIHASPEHLTAYVDEAVYRFNVRSETEWERFNRAMHLIVGKRLTYKDLTGGAIR